MMPKKEISRIPLNNTIIYTPYANKPVYEWGQYYYDFQVLIKQIIGRQKITGE